MLVLEKKKNVKINHLSLHLRKPEKRKAGSKKAEERNNKNQNENE